MCAAAITIVSNHFSRTCLSHKSLHIPVHCNCQSHRLTQAFACFAWHAHFGPWQLPASTFLLTPSWCWATGMNRISEKQLWGAEKQFKTWEAMINAMETEEREDPDLLASSSTRCGLLQQSAQGLCHGKLALIFVGCGIGAVSCSFNQLNQPMCPCSMH